jgi:hypothetical protein
MSSWILQGWELCPLHSRCQRTEVIHDSIKGTCSHESNNLKINMWQRITHSIIIYTITLVCIMILGEEYVGDCYYLQCHVSSKNCTWFSLRIILSKGIRGKDRDWTTNVHNKLKHMNNNNSHPLLPYPLPSAVDSDSSYIVTKRSNIHHMIDHMINHVTYLPDWYHNDEESAQRNIADIAEDIVECT